MYYISAPGISRFLVEMVSSPQDLQQGLSGRESLLPRQGMLFVFPSLGKQSMWMPNMNFPLDIVWVDEDKVIVKIEKNVNPCVGNHNCKSYVSGFPVLYAVELNAGDATRIGLQVGLKLAFIAK
jgi:uncharacterized membrane protein (UPF0127 family)